MLHFLGWANLPHQSTNAYLNLLCTQLDVIPANWWPLHMKTVRGTGERKEDEKKLNERRSRKQLHFDLIYEQNFIGLFVHLLPFNLCRICALVYVCVCVCVRVSVWLFEWMPLRTYYMIWTVYGSRENWNWRKRNSHYKSLSWGQWSRKLYSYEILHYSK